MTRTVKLDVAAGQLPLYVQGPDDTSTHPALVVVPSIFGPAPDLLERLSALAADTFVVVPDPFWRTGEGVVPYDDLDGAIGRLGDFDVKASASEMRAAVDWARSEGNGRVVAVGICFGAPFVLTMAADGLVDGVVTWHGSRMDSTVDRAGDIVCPVHHHAGGADAATPPELLAALAEAMAGNADAKIFVHDGAEHGFTHDGHAHDHDAERAAFGSVVDLLDRLR